MTRAEGIAAASRSGSRIFRCIEDLQGDQPWGSVLDAGTGTNSIGWISSLETDSWTAVTGAEGHARQVLAATAGKKQRHDRVILGDWADPEFVRDERFDTVLDDYLIGAIEGFAPLFSAVPVRASAEADRQAPLRGGAGALYRYRTRHARRQDRPGKLIKLQGNDLQL